MAMTDKLKKLRASLEEELNKLDNKDCGENCDKEGCGDTPAPTPEENKDVESEEETPAEPEKKDVALEGEPEEKPILTEKPEETPAPEATPAPEVESEDNSEEEPEVEAEEGEEFKTIEAALAKPNTKVSMLLLENGNDYSWVLSAGTVPVALISLNNMDKKEAIRSHFKTSGFRDNVFESLQKMGVRKTLSILKASIISDGSITASVPSKENQIDIDSLKRKIKYDLTEKMQLAATALNNNLLNGNPLKEAFCDIISQNPNLPVPELVQAAFQVGGEKYFNRIIGQAEEWDKLTEQSFNEMVSIISGMSKSVDQLLSEQEDDSEDSDDDIESEEDCIESEEDTLDGDALAAALTGNSIQFNSRKSPTPHNRKSNYRKLLDF